jgi:hypothetical protein
VVTSTCTALCRFGRPKSLREGNDTYGLNLCSSDTLPPLVGTFEKGLTKLFAIAIAGDVVSGGNVGVGVILTEVTLDERDVLSTEPSSEVVKVLSPVTTVLLLSSTLVILK